MSRSFTRFAPSDGDLSVAGEYDSIDAARDCAPTAGSLRGSNSSTAGSLAPTCSCEVSVVLCSFPSKKATVIPNTAMITMLVISMTNLNLLR